MKKTLLFSLCITLAATAHAMDSFEPAVNLKLEDNTVHMLTRDDLTELRGNNGAVESSNILVGRYLSKFDDDSYEISKYQLKPEPESITPEHVEGVIAKEQYLTPTDTLTICVLTLQNGFTVTGESACADPAKFDKALGEKYARKQAFDKAWSHEGYLLKERLFRES